MDIRGWIMRRIWGGGRSVRYVFIHPTCGHDDVEAGYLPEWGQPKFLCRRCGVAFDEASVRLRWPGGRGTARRIGEEGTMQAVFENRRSGGERRSGERRRGTRCPSCCNGSPADSARIPNGQDRRSGTDRRRAARRIADGADLIPERYDYQWRNRWP